jgi:hypothetical protein
VRRQEHGLVPLGHLRQVDPMLNINAIHEGGFACLGLAVGLAALWSP